MDNVFNKNKKQAIGQKGEGLAADFLRDKGFAVVDKNYRRPWGEIDLVVKKASNWRFVEVKTVSRENLSTKTGDDYEPEDNIHPWKRKRLRRIIQTYLLAKNLDDADWQVDAVAVYLSKTGAILKIDWLEDVVL